MSKEAACVYIVRRLPPQRLADADAHADEIEEAVERAFLQTSTRGVRVNIQVLETIYTRDLHDHVPRTSYDACMLK